MRSFGDLIVRGRELSRGQTMTEYLLIVATIAVISIAMVENGGTILLSLVNGIDVLLLS